MVRTPSSFQNGKAAVIGHAPQTRQMLKSSAIGKDDVV
jgi:hypothetical protein